MEINNNNTINTDLRNNKNIGNAFTELSNHNRGVLDCLEWVYMYIQEQEQTHQEVDVRIIKIKKLLEVAIANTNEVFEIFDENIFS